MAIPIEGSHSPGEVPSGTVLYELDNGRLIAMPPPGDLHGAYELNIGAALKYQGERRGFGKARSGEVGVILRRNPKSAAEVPFRDEMKPSVRSL